MKKLFALLLFGILIFGCTGQQEQPKDTGPKTVAFGSNVDLFYTLKLEDGTVLQASPLSVKISFDGGLIPGFEKGLVGMKENETKIIVVPPEEGYGLSDSEKVYSIDRRYNMSRFEKVPLSELKSSNVQIKKDFVIKTNAGFVAIYDFDNETATLEYLLKENDSFVFNGFPQRVAEKRDDEFIFEISPEVNKSYQIENPNGQVVQVLVKDVNESVITLDQNHPLAGKTLYFEVTVNKIN